jgi:hypothetical protein
MNDINGSCLQLNSCQNKLSLTVMPLINVLINFKIFCITLCFKLVVHSH